MKGYKGFHKGMICRGKQYAENTVFEEPEANIYKNGMHFCKNPFDVLGYYDFVCGNGELNEFAEVEALDEVKTDDDRKFCTKKLKIGAKLSFAGFVKACVEFVIEKTTGTETENDISSSGDFTQIGSSGYDARIGSTGNSARIGSSGDYAQIGSSGDYAQIGSSGEDARIGSSGDFTQIGSSGDCARIGSSGEDAQIGSSGDAARIGSSGEDAQIGSSGDYARIGSSGDAARIGSTGNVARIASEGEDSVICCAGTGSRVKAKRGSWITLSEWGWDEKKGKHVPVCVKTEYVDGERIKENVFYMLRDGEFQEVEA